MPLTKLMSSVTWLSFARLSQESKASAWRSLSNLINSWRKPVDAAQFLTVLADVLNLLLLNGRLFLRWQNHQKRSAPRGKATPARLGSQAWFEGFPLSGLGRKVCSPLGDQAPE